VFARSPEGAAAIVLSADAAMIVVSAYHVNVAPPCMREPLVTAEGSFSYERVEDPAGAYPPSIVISITILRALSVVDAIQEYAIEISISWTLLFGSG
jgi:hypothetical protein